MLEYMMNHPEGTILYQSESMTYLNTSLLMTVHQMCLDHLFSYDGYRQAIKRSFSVSHCIPIYLCEELQLIPTGRYRSYETIYINRSAIQHYDSTAEGIRIIFFSGRIVDIKISLYRFEKQLHLLQKIRGTKVKHFH